jgi:hypothetical protein
LGFENLVKAPLMQGLEANGDEQVERFRCSITPLVAAWPQFPCREFTAFFALTNEKEEISRRAGDGCEGIFSGFWSWSCMAQVEEGKMFEGAGFGGEGEGVGQREGDFFNDDSDMQPCGVELIRSEFQLSVRLMGCCSEGTIHNCD